MKKYTKITSKFIDDIKSNITIYKHNKTNARICTIENDDNNKVFSIAFRTPPINDGGLTHILEHSVLCGSKKYPVKDPFVELLKSSLNTFLNAFTFPDKTMYPCASQNEKDFKNLMSVYMDAVFYPQIYQHEEIFMQEGWHYHILNEEDPITYNGVVYNEMKGAFSDPQQILFRKLMHSLYPDNAYGFESGGDPKYIPDLTYEEFKNFHSKFYHPTNSYIFLYGNCDMEERMDWLDSEYLSNFEAIDFDTTVKLQKPFDKPVYSTHYYPTVAGQPLNDKTLLSYNVALPSTLDAKLMIATNILVDVLLNNPGAPLKQALIDAKLGADVMAAFDDGLLQPLLAIIVVNSNEDKEQEFIDIVNKELIKLLENGLNHDALKSLINYQEFKVREGKFGYMPKGLEIQMTCLNSWLYNEEDPYSKLETLKYFEELRKDLDNGYFENIIKEYILDNNHKTFVKLVPSYTCAEETEKELAEKLSKFKETLSKEQLQELIKKNKALAVYQSEPSTPEAIETLPKLALEDLNREPEKLNCQEISGEYPILHSEYFTNGINYIGYNFDMTGAGKEDVMYAQLLANLFTNISTSKHNFLEINSLIQNLTGGLHFNVYAAKTVERMCRVGFEVSFSALEANVRNVNELVLEIINNSDFDDHKRLFERISEINVANEMGIANRGHVVSAIRAGSYLDETMEMMDSISGLGYLDFIHELLSDFENKKEEIVKRLKEIKNQIFIKKNFLLKFTGEKESLNHVKESTNLFYKSLFNSEYRFNTTFEPCLLNEGIKTQFDVNFVSRFGKYDGEFDGAMLVLNNALSLDYLWMQVRVHGGAYGCMLQTPHTGTISFMSYRDPEVARTNTIYEDVVSYIKNLNPTEEELLKYKIGAIGTLDQVLHNSTKGNKAQSDYLNGYTYELQKKYRSQALDCQKEDLVVLADKFREALDCASICVIGNSNKVDANNTLFKSVRNLNK